MFFAAIRETASAINDSSLNSENKLKGSFRVVVGELGIFVVI
jgi:hypothetical protein